MNYTTLFMTNDDSEIIFNTLLKESQLLGVCTGTKKKRGRGQLPQNPYITTLATAYALKVYQPTFIKSNKQLENELQSLHIDFLIVYSYGFILPESFLEIPKKAAINLHTSLLPKYRGASPIQTALLNGDTETGVTAQLMSKNLDAGDILHQIKTPIKHSDTYITLHKKLTELSAQCIAQVLTLYKQENITPHHQNHSKASYCKKIKKEDGWINWQDSHQTLSQKIKAYIHFPQTYTFYQSTKIIIHEIDLISQDTHYKPGQIIQFHKTGIHIQCGNGIIRLVKLQAAGRKSMNDSDFVNGHTWQQWSTLESSPHQPTL